jgi:ureidoglycolate dehydrogenase (NAD+)
MSRIQHDAVSVDAADLRALTREVLIANDVPAADADAVARHLVETNLRGTDSHGVARLPHYVRRLQAGSIRARPTITFEQRAPSLGTVDGGDGLGHLVMARATDEAARLAETTGSGWVAVQNSSHCGAIAPFGLELARRGCIGFVFTHVDPMVLPHGGREPFCGTNPICIAAPAADGRSLCLDMATSIVPWNLVANAAQEGATIPAGWGVDATGAETTDPRAVKALYPVGQHKGAGLGIMIDVLCSMLVGAPFGPNIPAMYGDLTVRRQLGGLVGAIAIPPFTDRQAFEARAMAMITTLRAINPVSGVDRVRYPGEPEEETRRMRELNGIPVGVRTLEELNALAIAHGVVPIKARAAA